MRFVSIGSGSKGNGTVVESQNARLLLDCGFGLKDTIRRLERVDVSPDQLDAILLTHEHGDHAKGACMLAKQANLPLYLTSGTYRCLVDRNLVKEGLDLNFINVHENFTVGDIDVEPVAVPHDAFEACQFIFHSTDHKLGVLTDTGSITPHIVSRYADCDSLLVEFNHDTQMLKDGPYPFALQQRVGGDYGHLSNDQAIEFLKEINGAELKHLLVAHVSEKNNDEALVRELIHSSLVLEGKSEGWLTIATQEEGSSWMKVKGSVDK